MSKALASPTKRFFVEMLTRDIELEDAILDLLDNCLDGANRLSSKKNKRPAKPYEGYWAKIALSADDFSIEDNCGGIPLDIAHKYAFRMGRERDDNRDVDLETVGMYGIGMKRAFFKMGRSTLVTSCHRNAKFTVNIPANWLELDDEWTFDLESEDEKPGDTPGTSIIISDLHPGISSEFGTKEFATALTHKISEHYATVLDKGFKIYVNDEPVSPKTVRLLYSEDGPKPHFFKHHSEGVDVFLAVGLNAPALTADDEVESPIGSRRRYEDGGWTIYCNDRAILVRDKSSVTGWGDKVPSYHWQFAVISGVVEFRAKNATSLPVTTTKRNMDASSELFLAIRQEMRTSMKTFTDYTNSWRHEPRKKQDEHFANAELLDIGELKSRMKDLELGTRRRGDLKGAQFYNPKSTLPRAPSSVKTSRRVVFTREISEIQEVARYLFNDDDVEPKEVGAKCFDRALRTARGKK